jgi:uncharacterized membrane protein
VHQRAALALTVAAILWTITVVAAPVAVSMPALGAPAAMVYAGASRICHQRPERSFHLNGVQLPVCGRCFGLYLSGALGALAAWGSRQRGHATRALLLVAAVPTAVTWSAEVAGLSGFSNLTRALAALPLGAAGGWVFVQMLRYDSSLDGHEIDSSRTHVHGR